MDSFKVDVIGKKRGPLLVSDIICPKQYWGGLQRPYSLLQNLLLFSILHFPYSISSFSSFVLYFCIRHKVWIQSILGNVCYFLSSKALFHEIIALLLQILITIFNSKQKNKLLKNLVKFSFSFQDFLFFYFLNLLL